MDGFSRASYVRLHHILYIYIDTYTCPRVFFLEYLFHGTHVEAYKSEVGFVLQHLIDSLFIVVGGCS